MMQIVAEFVRIRALAIGRTPNSDEFGYEACFMLAFAGHLTSNIIGDGDSIF
jgi:hypothetical protein